MPSHEPPVRPRAKAASLERVQRTETVHHRAASAKRKRRYNVEQLNLTSMLDVTFLLLIFFVLTASFNVGEGILPAEMPRGKSAVQQDEIEPPEQPIFIQLKSLGGDEVSIQLEGSRTPPASFTELYSVLNSLRYSESNPTAPFNADDPVVIRPDAAVPWTHVVNAFNAAVRAQYTNINFAQPPE